ncbi:NIPSNAP domain-containing protein [Mycobacterium sp. PS03-16]|uniref:NIPSNAP family protein n=1 Tax=Mycobacterium sp. PS03-16 TaxID=2559611 RepID=UPI00107347E7|nr:NIPSNAP family protein [Mycobacterium sp. PS03-16]TFV55810.1 NIPSNAP domain-containing protein [Mycobacterium sp. PS03-16]
MELRTYSLASRDALRHYVDVFWPRHIRTLGRYGITVHGVWTDTTSDANDVIALIGYPPGADPLRLAQRYRASSDFARDHADFDTTLIVSTRVTALQPIAASPLR